MNGEYMLIGNGIKKEMNNIIKVLTFYIKKVYNISIKKTNKK